MKKVLFLAGVTLLSASSFAQVSFGAQIGGNLANAKVESTVAGSSFDQDNKSKFGFLVGGVAEVPLTSAISFRPELNFIQKGYKYDESVLGFNYTEEVTLNYLELPLNFVYNFNAGSGKVFVGLGPSIGFGLSGKYKTTSTGDPDESFDVKFDGKKAADVTDNNAHLKAIDFGGSFLAGYKMANGLFVTAGYNTSFSNIAPDDNVTFRNSGFAIKVGYMFGGSKKADKK